MSTISAPNAAPLSATGQGVEGPLPPRPWLLPAVLLGVVAGAALQLQQPALWSAAAYGWLLTAGLLLGGGAVAAARRHPGLRRARSVIAMAPWLMWLAGALAMFGGTGLRAVAYQAQALPAALEGKDLRITGVVAAMPQVNEAGTRWRMAVESATLQGSPVTMPPQIDVAWYGGAFGSGGEVLDLQRQPAPVRAGERWQITVRLKAPHGLRNPHGFDYELWMWEQGVQATGYVRAGPKDEPPVRVAATWQVPVEQLRQRVRDAILERLVFGRDGAASESADTTRARTAGVVAALVTGDQRAIDLDADIKVENWDSL